MMLCVLVFIILVVTGVLEKFIPPTAEVDLFIYAPKDAVVSIRVDGKPGSVTQIGPGKWAARIRIRQHDLEILIDGVSSLTASPTFKLRWVTVAYCGTAWLNVDIIEYGSDPNYISADDYRSVRIDGKLVPIKKEHREDVKWMVVSSKGIHTRPVLFEFPEDEVFLPGEPISGKIEVHGAAIAGTSRTALRILSAEDQKLLEASLDQD